MQVKLLRAIQEKAVRPIGSTSETPIDVRILSATHKNLAELIEQGKFRQDLYYRINVIEVHVAPLRERPEDIETLTEKILQDLTEATGSTKPLLDEEAKKALFAYPFPGNVRELENILERAMTLCENNIISTNDLRLPNAENHDTTFPGVATLSGGVPLEDQLGNIEKEAILQALEKTRHNKTAAAKLLGMSFRSLRYRLKKLGLE
jgi:two-component system response regulator PilR (NtrC family)